VAVVFDSHTQEHIIDSFVGLRSGGKLPTATATTGMNLAPLHVDVVEPEVAVFSGHDWSRSMPSVSYSKSLISSKRFRRRLGSSLSLSFNTSRPSFCSSSLKCHSVTRDTLLETTGVRPYSISAMPSMRARAKSALQAICDLIARLQKVWVWNAHSSWIACPRTSILLVSLRRACGRWDIRMVGRVVCSPFVTKLKW
jgi:hypothetical protein